MNVAVRILPGAATTSPGPVPAQPPPPPKPPLQKRSSDREFREVLGVGLAIVRKSLITVALFSFAVNTLILAVPIYLFQISDRVLTSRSIDTLVMLTIVVVGRPGRACPARHDAPLHPHADRRSRRKASSGAPVLSAAAKASQNGSSRGIPGAGRPPAVARLHHRPGAADHARRAGDAALSAGGLPDSPPSRLHRRGHRR